MSLSLSISQGLTVAARALQAAPIILTANLDSDPLMQPGLSGRMLATAVPLDITGP
jgi:hypothetical protein